MPQQGDKFGYYHLVKPLGTGGFAQVWLGKHELMHNEAAIKILLTLQLPTQEERDKFLDEARHLASFSDPHIVRVLECGIQDNTPFLALEYAPDGTLRTRHPKGTRLSPNVIVDYVNQIAAGLKYAHDRRLIHRDVKPENMLLRNNQVLISDFGIAAAEKTSSFRKMQTQDDVMGTMGYMAPEQYDGNPTTASDQYALGVVVYEWLCGALPFKGTPVEIRTQQKMKPPRLRDKVPGISPTLEQVVLTALSEDLSARFRDIQTFADELEKAVRNPNNPLVVQAQGNPIHQNNALGAAGPIFPQAPRIPNLLGGANNPMLPPNPGVPNTPPNGPLVLGQAIGANNAIPPPNPGVPNTPLNGPFTANPAGGINNPVPPPNAGVPNNPLILRPPSGANNPLANTNPAAGNNPYPGAPPLSPNIPYSPFHGGPTVGASPFGAPPAAPTQTTSDQRRRTKLFDWRSIFGVKNRLFVFGGGLIDFILAVALGVWLNDGDVSWNLWLVSLLSAWVVRLFCAGCVRKYLAIPSALALAFYWFLGSWALVTAFNAALHINVIPPHIIAILVLFVATIVHVLYATKKR
jgi:serine/threonine protein kinase